MNHHRIRWGCVERLDTITRFPEMGALGADVTQFQHPALAEFTLQRQVPLLRVGNFEVAWHFEAENSNRSHTGTARGVDIVRSLIGVAAGKRVGRQHRETGEIGGVETPAGGNAFGFVARVPEKKLAKLPGAPAPNAIGKQRRLEAQLVDGADVLTDEVDSVAAAQSRVVMAEDVPGEAEPGTDPGGNAVFECRIGRSSGKSARAEFAYALGIDERIGSAERQIRLEIADVASVVLPCSKELGAKAEIDREIRAYLPVVLDKEGVILLTVLVGVKSAAAKAELGRAKQEVLEVGVAVTGVGEEQLPVENLGKFFVEVDWA